MKKLFILILTLVFVSGCAEKPYISLGIEKDSFLIGEVVKTNITTNLDNVYAYGEGNLFNGLWNDNNWQVYKKNVSGDWVNVKYSGRISESCNDGEITYAQWEPPALSKFNFSEFEWNQNEYYPVKKKCDDIIYTDWVNIPAEPGTYKLVFCYTNNSSRKIMSGTPLDKCIEKIFEIRDSVNKQTLFVMPESSYIKIVNVGSYYPGYSLVEIYKNGVVVYQSGEYIPDITIEEKKVFQISVEKLEQISALFYENNFFSLNGTHYNNPEINDASTSTTSINIDGKIYSVSEYAGSGPDSLNKINDALWDFMFIYCEQDSDCTPCCGTWGASEGFVIEGRGRCVNKDLKYNAPCDAGCELEYEGECVTCRCVNNQCSTLPTGDIRC